MKENKKETAPEIPVQEQSIYKKKDLEAFALKIFCQIYNKNISIDNAKTILKMCSDLIDLNSRMVIDNDKVIVG